MCPKCEYENQTKGGIKVHLTKKHNEVQIRYNVKMPLLPENFRRYRHFKQTPIQKTKLRIHQRKHTPSQLANCMA